MIISEELFSLGLHLTKFHMHQCDPLFIIIDYIICQSSCDFMIYYMLVIRGML